jgi:hypothetical protein
LAVKNGWNSYSRTSAGMPVPLSGTLTSTSSPRSRVVTLMVGRKPASLTAVRRLLAALNPLQRC